MKAASLWVYAMILPVAIAYMKANPSGLGFFRKQKRSAAIRCSESCPEMNVPEELTPLAMTHTKERCESALFFDSDEKCCKPCSCVCHCPKHNNKYCDREICNRECPMFVMLVQFQEQTNEQRRWVEGRQELL